MIVVFAAEAERNLEEIGDHIALDDPERAQAFIAELRESCLSLSEFPARFRLTERYRSEGIRQRLHGDYLIFDRIEADRVVIIHILHGARDYLEILSRDR